MTGQFSGAFLDRINGSFTMHAYLRVGTRGAPSNPRAKGVGVWGALCVDDFAVAATLIPSVHAVLDMHSRIASMSVKGRDLCIQLSA